MTFQDLPADWPSMALTDPRITDDVLDLMVSGHDRDRGAIILLLCDPADRLVQPFAVGQLDDPQEAWTHREIIEPFAEALTKIEPEGSILVAIARGRGLAITDDDRAWHQAAIDACRDSGVRLLGVHVVTHSGPARLSDYASVHHES
jgi:hypothetical protein